MKPSQSSVADFLHVDNQNLQKLMTHLQQLKQWNSWLTACIPEEKNILQHCQIVRYEHQQLFVITESAHWITRFRFYIPDLLEKLKKTPDFHQLKSIDCAVRPDTSKQFNVKKSLPRAVLSPKNANILKTILEKTRTKNC